MNKVIPFSIRAERPAVTRLEPEKTLEVWVNHEAGEVIVSVLEVHQNGDKKEFAVTLEPNTAYTIGRELLNETRRAELWIRSQIPRGQSSIFDIENEDPDSP